MFENRKYVIINANEISLIDFDQVMQTNADTCRYSVDETKTFVKYDGTMPSSVNACGSKSQEYTRDEILEILAGDDWTVPEAE
jgi:hypothetical protein